MLYLYGRSINTKDELLDVSIENGLETGSVIQEACSKACEGTRCETCKYVRRKFENLGPCTSCSSANPNIHTDFLITDKYEYGDNKAKKFSEV